MGSIQVANLSPADLSRFIHLPLSPAKNNYKQFGEIEDAMNEAISLAPALFAYCVNTIDVYRANIKKIAEYLAKEKNMRSSDQLSPLIAGYCCLANQGVVDDAQISEIIKCIMGDTIKTASRERDTDANRCFADILNLPLPQTGGGIIGKTAAEHIGYVVEALSDPELTKEQIKAKQAPLFALGMRCLLYTSPSPRD